MGIFLSVFLINCFRLILNDIFIKLKQLKEDIKYRRPTALVLQLSLSLNFETKKNPTEAGLKVKTYGI